MMGLEFRAAPFIPAILIGWISAAALAAPVPIPEIPLLEDKNR